MEHVPSNTLPFLSFQFGLLAFQIWQNQYPTRVGLVVLAWDLGVCSSQGLRFDSPQCQFGGLVHIGLCSSMKRGPQSHKWTVGLDPKISQSLGRMPSFQTKRAESDRTNFIYSITYISKQSNGNFFSIKFHQALDIQTQPYCHYFLWLLTASCFFFFLLCLCQVPSLCKSLLM